MTTKHTPGPWAAIGRDVLSMHAHPRASGPLVCIIDDNDNARWPADSALIAAAPDLLDALEAAHGYLVMMGTDHADHIRSVCLAAILKAQGKKP